MPRMVLSRTAVVERLRRLPKLELSPQLILVATNFLFPRDPERVDEGELQDILEMDLGPLEPTTIRTNIQTLVEGSK